MKVLYSCKSSLTDESIQADFLDWILTDKVNMFHNRETRELAYALISKRGNSFYAAKKNETINEIIEAANSSVLDFPVDDLRDNEFRQTQVLSFTLTFSHKRFSPGGSLVDAPVHAHRGLFQSIRDPQQVRCQYHEHLRR